MDSIEKDTLAWSIVYIIFIVDCAVFGKSERIRGLENGIILIDLNESIYIYILFLKVISNYVKFDILSNFLFQRRIT